MKREKLSKRIYYNFIVLLLVICCAGCAKNEMVVEESTQVEENVEAPLYLVVENNLVDERLTIYSFVTGLEHHYKYNFATQFLDKYGNLSSVSKFEAGKVVLLGDKDSDGYLTKIQLSDQVWEYEDVKRFSIDKDRGVFTIADTRYSIQDRYFVFSNGNRSSLDLISKEDVLTVIGKENKIISILVTTGHGELHLTNTELFEGSYLQLNNDKFFIITENMYQELPEGTYTLKVANDGWGGTTEIEIIRGEITEIDLDTLKGEGKKRGNVTFQVDVEGVQIYVDYELVDHTNPVELTYGVHVLEIKAEGYNAWKKRLAVNSPDATLVIELEEDGTSSKPMETESSTEEETEPESEAISGE